jgi:hypothetical protein
MNKMMIISSIIGGIIVTLVTGLILNTPPMLMGASHFGYPFPWLIKLIIHPKYFPWRVNILFLVVDIVFWTIIIGIISFIAFKIRKS